MQLKQISRLNELLETLNKEEDIVAQEEILNDIVYSAKYALRDIIHLRESYWVAKYEDDPMSDYSHPIYVLLGFCTKEEAFARLSKYASRIEEHEITLDALDEGVDFIVQMNAVDNDSYLKEWRPLMEYTQALYKLECLPDCPKEIVARLKELTQSLRIGLGFGRWQSPNIVYWAAK